MGSGATVDAALPEGLMRICLSASFRTATGRKALGETRGFFGMWKRPILAAKSYPERASETTPITARFTFLLFRGNPRFIKLVPALIALINFARLQSLSDKNANHEKYKRGKWNVISQKVQKHHLSLSGWRLLWRRVWS